MTKSSYSSRRRNPPIQDIPSPKLVQTAYDFAEMMAYLRERPLLAVDTESDSLYRYTPRICLIQVSTYAEHPESQQPANTPMVVDFLVDPLNLENLDALGEPLADPSVQVILHAAENDILLLQRDFDFQITNIFDTQLAARILGRNGVGLAAMLEEEFSVLSDKSMQRTDWGRRPLTPQQLTYAQLDTHFLPALRLLLIEQLQQAGRWREAQEAFAYLETLHYVESEGRTVWSMKNTRDVEREKMGLLEELWLWREDTAQRLDRPPFKVMNDQALIHLTQQAPTSLSHLQRIPGLSNFRVDRFGQELLSVIERGKHRPLPDLPAPTMRPELMLDKREQKLFQMLRQWRSQTANERGVDPDIVLSNEILLQIVDMKPQTIADLEMIPAIGPWKAETYGPAILTLVQKYHQ